MDWSVDIGEDIDFTTPVSGHDIDNGFQVHVFYHVGMYNRQLRSIIVDRLGILVQALGVGIGHVGRRFGKDIQEVRTN